jgi:hypothetical protein
MVSTKMVTLHSNDQPCDECSPVMYDCGVRKVVANVQLPKSPDDPARFRGLTYDKIKALIHEILLF